jgi:hypothetical protein
MRKLAAERGRPTFAGMKLLVAGLFALLPACAMTDGSPPHFSTTLARTETVTGAYERASERLEPFTRQMELDRQNQGANGRKNTNRDEMTKAMTPSLAPRPLSSW